MNTICRALRVTALLPALQNVPGAIAALAAGATVNSVSQTISLEQLRATTTQSGSGAAGEAAARDWANEQAALRGQRASAPGPVTPNVASSPLDAFQSKLQSKTEQEIMKLMEEARAAKQATGTAAEESEEAQEEEEVPNPDTGELYGPRGREPTRYGDWENKGKCIDF